MVMERATAVFGTVLLLVAVVCTSRSSAAASGRWVEYVSHGDVTAYVNKSNWCHEIINIRITAPEKTLVKFHNSQMRALMKTVHMLLEHDCKTAEKINIVSYSDEEVVNQKTMPVDALKSNKTTKGEIERAREGFVEDAVDTTPDNIDGWKPIKKMRGSPCPFDQLFQGCGPARSGEDDVGRLMCGEFDHWTTTYHTHYHGKCRIVVKGGEPTIFVPEKY